MTDQPKRSKGQKGCLTEGESRKTKSFCRPTQSYNPDFTLHALKEGFCPSHPLQQKQCKVEAPKVCPESAPGERQFKDRTYQKIFGWQVRALLLSNCSWVRSGLTTKPCRLKRKPALSVKDAQTTHPLPFPSLFLCARAQVCEQRPDLSRGHSVSSVP